MRDVQQKRVLQVVSALGNGGVESMLINIYKNIDNLDDKIIFDFVVHTNERKYIKDIKKNGGHVYQIESMMNSGVVKYIKELKKIIKFNGPYHAVHAHILFQNGIILLAAKIAGVKIRVSHSHLTDYQRHITKLFSPFLRLLILIFANRRLACGKEAGRFLYGFAPFFVISNAVDTNIFINATDKNKELRNTYALNDKTLIIGHIGRLSMQKNHHFIINLAEKMRKRGIDFCILCAGDGGFEEKIRKLISEKGLNNNVILLGARNDIPELLKSFDVFILPSLFEGLPVVLIEAQAAGVNSVVADTITIECDLGLSLIEFLSLDEQIDVWIDRILSCNNKRKVDDKDIRSRFIERGYDIKNCAHNLITYYDL